MNELKILLNKIESYDKGAQFIFVGDWIDRGPNVPDVIEWVVDNITLDGKYQSIRGNHEHEAYFWYIDALLTWYEKDKRNMKTYPRTTYDFSDVVKDHYDANPTKI